MMKFWNFFKNKIIIRLNDLAQRQNILVLAQNSTVEKGVQIEGSKLYGEMNIRTGSIIKSSHLSGNIEISEGVLIRNKVTIQSKKRVKIGRYTAINGPNTDIICDLNDVEIGAFCSIARNVTIQESNHNYKNFTTSFIENKLGIKCNQERISKGKIVIENDVWIGSQCVILSGAKIGTGAVIAANSVVLGEIPPYAIVAGSPAKVLKYRFDEIKIKELLESQWWYHINKENYEEFKIKFNSI